MKTKALDPELGTGVMYARTFPSVWPGVTDYVQAEVYLTHAGWYASCDVSLPRADRRTWGAGKLFADREEAAAYAAAFVLEAERLVAAVERGETPALVSDVMRAECARDLAATDIPSLPYLEREQKTHEFQLAWFRARDFRTYLAAMKETR